MTVELNGRATVPVKCGECGWSNDGTLTLVDRYATDYPPIPRFSTDAFIEVYRDECGDPDDRIIACDACESPLDRHECVERDC